MNPIFKVIVKINIALFRMTGGRLGASMKGTPILLLTTIGNKSGQSRTVPVMQIEDGGKRYVIGSMGGQPEDPAWIKNIHKTPQVEVEARGEKKYRATASLLSGDERNRVYEIAKKQMNNFVEYEKKTTRQIPVVLLTPL